MGDIMLEKALNFILLRNTRAKRAADKFIESIGSELAEGFLDLLLRLMSLVFMVNKKFRRNIEDFNGRYLFMSKDKRITRAAIFQNGKMKVIKNETDRPNVTIIFRNGKILMNFLLSPKPDILGSMLRQDVSINGNLNYLYKFAYMAKRLQLMATGKV